MAVESSSSIKAGTSADAATTLQMERYINLADYTYTSGLQPFSTEMETKLQIKPLTNANGQIVKSLVNRTGFYGEAFVTTGPGPQQIFVAYEGTNLKTAPTPKFAAEQVEDDYELFKGGMPSSFQTALAFTQRVMRLAGNDTVTLAGHSLGAADAEYVAAKTGLGGVTFGTPGVSTAITGSDAGSTLVNYVDEGDPVGNYSADAPRYLGSIVQSNDILHYGQTHLEGADYRHDLLEAAADAYAKHTYVGDALAVATLGFAASQYHLLGNYAADLGLKLYGPDRTVGSGTSFFDPVDPTHGAFLGVLGVHRDLGHHLLGASVGQGAGAAEGSDAGFASAFHHVVSVLTGASHGHG